jgi:hypothetical protein
VLSVGGIAGYSKAMTKFKINKTADQISQIVTNIRTLYAQQTSYAGLDLFSGNIFDMGIIPDSLSTSNSYPYITNAFNGGVYISSDYFTDDDAFIVTFQGLPKEACVTLATMDWGSVSSSGFTAILVGREHMTGPWEEYSGNCGVSTSYAVACSGDSTYPSPMSVATAASACSQCAELDYSCNIGLRFQ